MRFALTDEEVAFSESLRALFARECSPTVVRAAWEHGVAHDSGVWDSLDTLGAFEVLADGGPGFVEVMLEEAGRCVLPHPLNEAALVAAPYGVGAALVATDLSGPVVAHACDAEVFLLHDRSGLHLVDPGDVELEPVATVDRSRRAARIVTWRPGNPVATDVTAAFDRGALGAAALLLGVAERMLEMTIVHVKERHQFGVPIGSFQAVKHQLADALRDLSFARPAVRRAADSLARDLPSVSRDVAMAKAMASDASDRVGRVALQAHGAVGYTVEYDLHLYLKRAWALSRAWGCAAEHRRRVANEIGL